MSPIFPPRRGRLYDLCALWFDYSSVADRRCRCHMTSVLKPIPTSITATLSVRNGAAAVAFYESAFGASVLHRVEDESGAVVAQLSVSGAEFWVSDESPQHQNYSPESLGGCSVRLLLIVSDPDAVCRSAVAAGATQIVPINTEHGWRLGRILDPFGHHWEIGRPLPHDRKAAESVRADGMAPDTLPDATRDAGEPR